MAVYALNQDVPLISMYSHQKNKILDAQILKGRNRYDNVFLIGRTGSGCATVKQFRQKQRCFCICPIRISDATIRFLWIFRYSDGNDTA